MSMREAAGRLVVLLLSVSVAKGATDWNVRFPQTQICAVKGSTLNITCSYQHPAQKDGRDITVTETFWFKQRRQNELIDLRADPMYAGRVQSHCNDKSCSLTIRDLRESDAAVYKFRFTINSNTVGYTGEPGVTLSVTGFQVQITSSYWLSLKCHTSCRVTHNPSYIWFENGKKQSEQRGTYSSKSSPDSVSCAVKGFEDFAPVPVCVGGQTCNRVNYTDRRICAFTGSSVDISALHYSPYGITSKFWFVDGSKKRWPSTAQNPQDSARFQVFGAKSERFTLRITDLRAGDSAQYRSGFMVNQWEWKDQSLGTTLVVKDPDLLVQVIQTFNGLTLTCHSSCLLSGRSSFSWYQDERKIHGQTSAILRGVNRGNITCGYEQYRSAPVYPPRVTKVSKNTTTDIVRGDSVSLTCISEANPTPRFTWYRNNERIRTKPQLEFASIQSSDAGEYHCSAENELGEASSQMFSVDVRYGPVYSDLSVSPSAEILRGSSVNLICRSDSNPPASYTWYKDNQTLHLGSKWNNYSFPAITSGDSGVYTCMAENQHGQKTSRTLFLDVEYAPTPPSVSASPSADIMEGSSVNLTCSADANPPATYTWYKENEVKHRGQIFTITDVEAEQHGGNYHCEVQNTRGRHRAILTLTVVSGAWTQAVTGTVICLLSFVLLLLGAFLWIRRNKSCSRQPTLGEKLDVRAQPKAELNQRSAAPQIPSAGQEDDLHYATINFSQQQANVIYGNIRPHGEEEEEEDVEYSNVPLNAKNSEARTRSQPDQEDSCVLYSTVNTKRT